MAEPAPRARRRWLTPSRLSTLLVLLASLSCLLPMLGGRPWTLVGLLLAQPLLGMAFSLRQGTRSLPDLASFRRDWLALAGLWAAAYALLALVAGWPLEALRERGALMSALGLGLSCGIVMIGLWRVWPIIGLAHRIGGPLSLLFSSAAPAGERDAGRGLVVAMAVFAVLASGLLLAWPGLLPASRWWWPAQLLLAISAHLLILRFGAAPNALPVVLMEGRSNEDEEDDGEGAEEDATDPDQRLYAAARGGRVEAALAALAEGADAHRLPDPEDRDQRSLPMLAALLGDLRLLRQLIARGADLNQAHAGLTPLLAATRDSWHGRPEAVMTLLANGADPRATDTEGNTPLHHAARSTDAAVAALLLDAGAEVDALNHEAITPLSVACEAGNWRMARFLIEHRAKPEPAEGQPVLLAAAGGDDDDPAGVMLLLKHKARIDARGARQRTALMAACAAGHAEIVGVLLEAGADRNAHDALGMTPLLETARNGHLPVLRRLALAKPDVSACDNEGRTALVHACETGTSGEFLQALLALGVDAGQRDGSGRRALEVALGAGRWSLVSALDPTYPLPASLQAAAAGEEEVAPVPLRTPRERLRDALQAEPFDPARCEAEFTAALEPGDLAVLLLEACEGDLQRLDWLLVRGASADARLGGEGDSVMFILLRRGGEALPALHRLLEHNGQVGGRGGLARYLDACVRRDHGSRGHEQFALCLLERGADASSAAEGISEAPLMSAVRLGWQRLLETLLQRGADPNVRDVRGHAPLHLAATLGREAALRALIRHGASPELRAADGQTAQGMALAANRRDASRWLEWRGWSLPGRPLQAFDLPAAAISGDRDALERLLDLDLPVDATDGQGCTALLRAAGGGHLEVVRLLLARGADAAIAARTGATALSAAISMRQVAVVDALLQAGARPNQALPGGVTPLMLAAALGLPDILSRLLAQGADPQATDDQGLGALHCAALHAFSSRDAQRVLAMFDVLLLADVAADAPNRNGHTPLLLLLGARAEAGASCDESVLLVAMERLLAEGVSLDRQDARGLSPLHLAAQHGLLRLVQKLLLEGANRHLRDTLGRSAHDLALLRGYVDVAAEFEPARASPSLARFLREPR